MTGNACPLCHSASVVWASTANGGRMTLDPYPDPDGRYRVATGPHGRVVLGEDQPAPAGATVKRWDPHRCGPPRGLRPDRRPQQTALDVQGAQCQ